MKISSVDCIDCKQSALNKPTCKAKVHIIDGFIHADNMEHFAKSAFKRMNKVSDLSMHYVECNHLDINTKQMSSVEDMLKKISSFLRRGDFLALPGLASVSILNLSDRIKNVLDKNVNLTPQNLKANKNIILEFLKEIYNYKSLRELLSNEYSFHSNSDCEVLIPLYYKYGIDAVWGLSPTYDTFIADTFYPELAQYGLVGVILFSVFCWWIWQKLRLLLHGEMSPLFVVGVLAFGFLAIDATSSCSVLQVPGELLMAVLGWLVAMTKPLEQVRCLNKKEMRYE